MYIYIHINMYNRARLFFNLMIFFPTSGVLSLFQPRFFLNPTCLFFHLTLPHMSFFKPHTTSFNLACLLFNTCNASFPSPLDSLPFTLCLLGLCGPCPTLFLLTPKSRGFWTLPLPVCAWWPVWPVRLWACVFVASVFFFVLGLGVQVVAADDSKNDLLLSTFPGGLVQ